MLAVPWMRMVLAGLVALLTSNDFAQGAEEPQARTAAPAATTSQTAPTKTPDQAGPGQPPVYVAATTDEASVMVVLRDLQATPTEADLSTGLLTNDQQAAPFSRPSIVSFQATPRGGSAKDFLAELRIRGLFAFGDSSVPLFYRGTLVETLRFSKPGLIVKPAGEGGFVAREGREAELLPLVLDNPSGFGYESVRARLRFADTDVCVFGTELFAGAAGHDTEARKVEPDGKSAEGRGTPVAPCTAAATWSEFKVPRYARVTLHVRPSPSWFRDPETGRARSSKKKGLLTLRFQAPPNATIFEQNLPLEVRFEPSTGSLFWSLVRLALLLLTGAILSLLVRVSVPNIKRKRQLRDELAELKQHTALISTEVDSDLRVLLRVERLALDELRQEGWQIGPSYADFARRVEQALPSLKRRIEAVRRLDSTLMRRRLLVEQGPAPTRLEQVDTQLNSVSETLKQDTLSEEDWVFVNQRLEAAQKIMREPSLTEKDAFDGLLARQWKGIVDHFGVAPAGGALNVPAALQGMDDCFPAPSLLPRADDADASKWVQSVGPVRADLQLYALRLLWEFEFLAPAVAAQDPQNRWSKAKAVLTRLLATPAVNNLQEARSLLRQLAEGVAEDDILTALRSGHATIVRDPSPARPNQKIRFSVRFRHEHLNSAAARDLVVCRWSFSDRHVPRLDYLRTSAFIAQKDLPRQLFTETGWDVHHYFEKDVDQSEIAVAFYDSKGDRVELTDHSDAPPWYTLCETVTESRRPREKWARGWLEASQLSASLLVPLATLASTTLNDPGAGAWWELVAIGFGSDTIKSILVGPSASN